MKILVVGNGSHTNRRILPSLANLNYVESIFVSFRDEINNKFKNEKLSYMKYDQILNSDIFFDAIVIATVPSAHLKNLDELKDKANILLLEKPISSNLDMIFDEKFKSLYEKKYIFECLMFKYHPLYQKYLEIKKSNKILKIKSKFTIPHIDKNNFRYNKNLGGGSLFDLGIYPISLISDSLDINNNFKKIDYQFDDELDVDLYGSIMAEDLNGTEIELEWGIGYEYKNYVELTLENSTYTFPFIFSKPEGYNAFFEIKKNDKIHNVNVGTHDQFELMYNEIIMNHQLLKKINTYSKLITKYKLIEKVKND